MPVLPFSVLNSAFRERIADPQEVSGSIFNYYKVFQHALSYELTDTRTKLIKNRLHLPLGIQSLVYRLKRYRGTPVGTKLQPILFMDDGRTIETENGTRVSYYLSKILHTLEKEKISILCDHNYPTGLIPDITSDLLDVYSNVSLHKEEKRVLKELVQLLKVNKSQGWVAPEYLSSAFHVFFEEFHRYFHFFRSNATKIFFFTNHYHREGMIAAAKMNGVTTIEIQHGLIAKQDLYYVYREDIGPVRDKALFPDKLILFGEYWKEILLEGGEHTDESLVVAGDYSLGSAGWKQYAGVAKENLIFIGAQKNMPDEYVSYTEGLLRILEEKHPDWKIVVKLHPYEKEPEKYAHLKKHPQCDLKGKEADLMQILSKAKIQISVYSTTFFDSLGLNVMNLSLQNYTNGADYAADMVDSGIARALDLSGDPVETYQAHHEEGEMERPHVYGPYSAEAIRELL